MIVAVLFVLLAVAVLAGAAGILASRRAARCLVFFLLCCSALAGLYGLLDMDYIAVIQLVTSLCMASLCLVFLRSEQADRARMPGMLGGVVVALVFLTLTAYAVLHGTLGEPILGALPIWAVPGEYLYTLGVELAERYTIALTLLALLLLTGILATAYVFRQADHAGPRRRRE